jgi:ATP-binding cassette subfamily C protein
LRSRLYTLFLRTVFFPAIEVSYAIPVAGVLLVGGWLHGRGEVGLGAVVAAALYLRQFAEPLDQILMRVEQLQSSGASFARVEGLAQARRSGAGDDDRPVSGGRPHRRDRRAVRLRARRRGAARRRPDRTAG